MTGPNCCAPSCQGSFGKHAMHDTVSRSPTLALLMPERLAIRIAQLFNSEQPFERLCQYDLGSIVECRAQRTSPILLIRPV